MTVNTWRPSAAKDYMTTWLHEENCHYTEDLIPFVQLSTEISWTACQDEGDKDPLAVLSSDDVKSQTCGASVDQNSTRLSEKAMKETK